MRTLTFIEWVRTRPCSVCNVGGADPDHYPNRSIGGTDDRVWPLCREHHSERHAIGMKSFQAKYEVDASLVIDDLRATYGDLGYQYLPWDEEE